MNTKTNPLTSEEMAFFREVVAESLEGPPDTPSLNALKKMGIGGNDIPDFGAIWQVFAGDILPARSSVAPACPWKSREDFLFRLGEARKALRMEMLNPKEAAFLDHLAYESMVLEGDAPAHRWLGEHGLNGSSLLDLEIAREKERHGPMYNPPEVPLEFPWETGEEAMKRNADFAGYRFGP